MERIASESSVKTYLDYLLAEMEIRKNKDIEKKFIDTFNYYKKHYDSIKEYESKASQILKEYNNKTKKK